MEAVQENKKFSSPHQTFLDYNRVHFKPFYKDVISDPKRYKKVQPGQINPKDKNNKLRPSFSKQKGSSSDINFSSLDISQISGKSQPASIMKQSYFDKTNLNQSQISQRNFLNRSTDQEPNPAILMEKKPKGKNFVDMMTIQRKPSQQANITVAKQQKPIIEENLQKLKQKGEYSSEANNNSKQLNAAHSKVSLSSNMRKQVSQQNSHISKQKSQSSQSKTSNNNILGFYNQMANNQLSAKQDHRPTESKTLQIQKKDEVVSKINPTQNLDKLKNQSQISKKISKKESQESDQSSDDSRDFDSIIAQKNKIKAQSSISNSQSQQKKTENKDKSNVKSQDESFFTIEVDQSQNILLANSVVSRSLKNQQNISSIQISKQNVDSGQKSNQKINLQKNNNNKNQSDSEKSYDEDDQWDFDSLLSKKVNGTVKSSQKNQIIENKLNKSDDKQLQNQKVKLQKKEMNQDNQDQNSDDDSDKSFGTIQKSFSMKQQNLSNSKQLNQNKKQSKALSDEIPKEESTQKVQVVQTKQPEESSSSEQQEDYESKMLKKTIQENQQKQQQQIQLPICKQVENQIQKDAKNTQKVQAEKETEKLRQIVQNSQKRSKLSSEHSFEEQSESDQQPKKQIQSRITQQRPDDKNTQDELSPQNILKESPRKAQQPIQSHEQHRFVTYPNQSLYISNENLLQTFLNQSKTFWTSSFLGQITNSITQSVKNQIRQLISNDFRSSIVKQVSQMVTKKLKQQIKAQKQMFYYEFKEMIVEEISEQFTQLKNTMNLKLKQSKSQLKCEIHQQMKKLQQPENTCQVQTQYNRQTMQKNQSVTQIKKKEQVQQEKNADPIFSSPDIRVIQDLKKDIRAQIVSSLGSEVKQFMRQEFRSVFKEQIQSFLQFQITQAYLVKEQIRQQSNLLMNKTSQQQFSHEIQNTIQQKQAEQVQISQVLSDTEDNVLENQTKQKKIQQNQSQSKKKQISLQTEPINNCNTHQISLDNSETIPVQQTTLHEIAKVQHQDQHKQSDFKNQQAAQQPELNENEQKQSDSSSQESFDESQ